MAHDNCKHCNPQREKQHFSRRDFFDRVADGLYGVALTTLLSSDIYGASTTTGERPVYDLKKRAPHFEPKAKSVIHLFMNGGPSQMDLFDPKPALDRLHGKRYFDRIAGEVENP